MFYVILRMASHRPARYFSLTMSRFEPVGDSSHCIREQNSFEDFDAFDCVNLTISSVPSTFGKLVFLADLLRDRNIDPLTEALYGKASIEAVLEWKQREIFFAWLGLSLSDQMDDVVEHFASECGENDTNPATLLQHWTHQKLYERLRPTTVGESEWVLFSSDLQVILRLLLVRLGSSEESHGG
jgi:hypothetical protein